MIEGQLIVLEGVDGAGTTTHTRLLAQWMESRGLPVKATREPSDGPIGMLLRQIITGRVVVPGIRGPRPPSWSTMALLFAADRLDHIEAEITPNLLDGVTILSDRYDHSSVAYQSITGGGEKDVVEWVASLNRFARRPDLTIVLDVPADTARTRRRSRPGASELYDDDELQAQLVAFYRDVERWFPSDQVVHVDANRSVDEVAKDIRDHVMRLRGELPKS